MRAATASEMFPGSVHEAEACWCDTSRWPMWVDGLERVLSVDGNWPCAGSAVRWESNPVGRGRVTERVIVHEELRCLSVDVDDDSISGRQTVTFTPVAGKVEVSLCLEYEIKQRSIFTPLIDVLFIRRAMTASLHATLSRFGAEFDAARPRR